MLLYSALPALPGTDEPTALLPHVVSRVQAQWLHSPTFSKNPAPTDDTPLLSLKAVLSDPPESDYFQSPGFRTAVLSATLQSLSLFVTMYKDLPCAVELLGPVAVAVEAVKGVCESGHLLTLRSELLARLQALLTPARVRPPLRLHTTRKEPVKSFNPKFEEEGYIAGRDYDPDRARAEQRKLKKQIKKEEKGAARELRKDNMFLAEERRQQREVYEGGREEKTKEVMALLQSQEADWKSGGQKDLKMFGKKKK